MTDRAQDRSTDELDMEWSVTAMLATGGFFQRPEPFFDPESSVGRSLSGVCGRLLGMAEGAPGRDDQDQDCEILGW